MADASLDCEPPATNLPAAEDSPTDQGLPPVEVRHGTAVRWIDRGILLLGASGAGKSDLALRLIDRGADLVADDLVRIEARGERLVARAQAQAGLIELRGQGIFRLPALAETALDLLVELGPASERLPEPATLTILGRAMPCCRLDPIAASAVARLRVLLTRVRVH